MGDALSERRRRVRVLLDTSVLIDVLRGDHRAVSVLKDLVRSGDEPWAVTISRTEIAAGMRDGEEERVDALFRALRWLDVTTEVADAAGTLARTYRRSHSGIDLADYLIAAAAHALGARLLTQNVRHFPMVSGISAAY
jgi:predicted nucleic acid-binding protein